MRQTRGLTLIELLVVGLVLLVVLTGLSQIFFSAFASRQTILSVNDAIMTARQPIDTLADHLRNAQSSGSGSTWSAPITAASASLISYQTDSSSVVTYLKSGSNLIRGDASGTKIVLTSLKSLTFTYYKVVGAYYTATLTTTDSPNAPTAAELGQLAAIDIDATVTVEGVDHRFFTRVRLRNSPQKTHL